MPAGYSGTPLPNKLGIRPGDVVALHGTPADFAATLGELPSGAKLRTLSRGRANLVLFFTTRRAELERRLPALAKVIFPDAILWLAWPKKSSGVASDLDENLLRDLALPHGIVDVKVCAIDATWSALKFVWRNELRGGAS